MNSFTSKRWLVPVLASAFLLLASSSKMHAQCTLEVLPAFAPVPTFTLPVDAVSPGVADLNANVISSYFQSDCAFSYVAAGPGPLPERGSVLFYTTASGGPAGVAAYHFTCSDVGTTLTLWVTNSQTTILGAPSPGTESPRREISVTIVDNTAPTLVCPANQMITTSSNGTGDCTGGYNIADPITDNCVGATWNATFAGNANGNPMNLSGLADGASSGSVSFQKGTTTVTLTGADASSNVTVPASCSFTVTVSDNEAPTLVCPADLTVNSSSNGTGDCTGTYTIADPITDNCSGSVWNAAFSGNVNGNPSNLNSLADGANSGAITFQKGATTVTLSGVDASSIVTAPINCAFTVTVADDELPVLTCPASLTINTSDNGTGDCTSAYTIADPLSDNCPGAVWNASYSGNINGNPGNQIGIADGSSSGSVTFQNGTTTVMLTATDAAVVPNAAVGCSFTVTVHDDELPTMAGSLNNYSFAVTPGNCSKVIPVVMPVIGAPVVNDNCTAPGSIVLKLTSIKVNGVSQPLFLQPWGWNIGASGAAGPHNIQFDAGTTKFYFSWTDAGNNVLQDSMTIFINESEPPVAKCKAGVVLPLNADGSATTLLATQVDDGSTDNCPGLSLAVSPNSFTCANIGTPTVSLTATDAAGNNSACMTTITVVDNTPPVVQCPANQFVSTAPMACTAVIPGLGMALESVPANLGPGEFFDNSWSCGGFTRQYSINGGSFVAVNGANPLNAYVFPTGTTNVTIRVRDNSSNATNCNFVVNVVDLVGPVFDTTGSVPNNGDTLVANTIMAGCTAQVFWTDPTVSDACSNPSVILSQTHASGSYFPLGMTTVTYVAKDLVGNITTYSFKVKVVDNQLPVPKCKNITVYLSNAGPATVTVSPADVDNGSTDNCFFAYVSTPVSYDCSHTSAVQPYVLTLVDNNPMNTASCTAMVTVKDTTAPVANCASISFVDLDGSGVGSVSANGTAPLLNNGSSDNCSISAYAIKKDNGAFGTSATFGCGDVSTNPHTITLRVTDNSGNTATCTRSVIVRDLLPPIFTSVPADVTVSCDAVPTYGTATAGDNCGPITITPQPEIRMNGLCANAYTLKRSWIATDGYMNSTTAMQTITVVDHTVPEFHLVDTIKLQTSSAVCTVPYTKTLLTGDVTDNCTMGIGNFGISWTIDYAPAAGVDASGFGTTLNGNFPIGTSKIVWTANDGCGNINSKTVVVVVKDAFPPVFSGVPNCGQHFVLPNTNGACSNLFTWQRPNASLMNVADCSAYTVKEFFSDSTVKQAINVVNPFNYNNGSAFQVYPTAQFPVGVTTVHYVATDAAGNSASCSFTVEIQDVQKPQLTCPPNQVFAATCEDAQIQDYRGLAIVTDNCGGNLVRTQTPVAGTTLGQIFMPNPPAAGQTFTVTIKAADLYNDTSCTFTVTLQDGDEPIPTIATLPDIVDSCGTYIIDAPTAIDPCNPNPNFQIIYGTPSTPVGQLLIGSNPPQYKLLAGSYVITWVYTDGNGNIATQPQNITVYPDTFPPLAICKPGFTKVLSAAGTVSISINEVDNGSTDLNDCGMITLALNKTSFNCSNLGVNTVTLSVTDTMGNVSTCSTTVTIEDHTAPVFVSVPADVTVEACTALPPFTLPVVSDVCDQTVTLVVDTVSTQDPSGYNFYNYSITLTYTATDDSGNQSTRVRTISVEDSQAPIFSQMAPDTVMVNTSSGALTCDAQVNLDLTPFVSDCATDDDLGTLNSVFPLNGLDASGIYSVGTHVVVFGAEDISGNLSTHSVVVIVKDATPPTAVCINGVSAALQPSGTVTVTYHQFNNNSFDNCAPLDSLMFTIQRQDVQPLQAPSAALTYTCADADGITHHPVKLFVQDKAGNSSVCETYIVIQDNVFPIIVKCPNSKTVQCTDDLSPALQGIAVATDNCTVDSINYTDVLSAGSGAFCQILTRTWKAIDQAHNVTTCTQVFSIQDTIKPLFTQLPPDVTISCSDVIGAPFNLTATDNCTNNVMVSFSQDTINIASGLCGKYNYTIRRTWTALDDCGNTALHSRKITVTDTNAPKFLGLPDTLTVFTANFPPNNNCTAPVSFNISQFLSDCAPVSEMTVTNDAPLGDTALIVAGNYSVGNYVVHFSATDPCGNVGLDSIVFQIVDNSVPTVICNGDVVVSLGSNGIATITPDDIDLGTTDNCGIATMFLSDSTFDCSQLGNNLVSLTAVDVHGNTNSCTVMVSVELGQNAGFNLVTNGSTVSYFGALDGSAMAMASGGSGNFSYDWSNGETTPTISNLNAGFYVVTVIDQATGCQKIDTVQVIEGEKLTLTIGTAGGAQGEIVSVPVSVTQFINMYAFSFSSNVNLPAVGTIVGISNVNPTLAPTLVDNLAGGILSVIWADANQNPQTLPDDTVLFFIDVELGTAPVGSTSPVVVSGTPVSIDFLQDQGGLPVSTMINTVNGLVEITNVPQNIQIAGDIKTWANPEVPGSIEKPVANVSVNLSGTVSALTTTGAPGTYGFMLGTGINTTTACSKTTAGNAGVTAGDLLRIVNHIFGDTLPSPYQWVAADVNNSKTVSLADYLIIQRLVLGTDQHLLNSPDWKFVPKAYTFPSNNTPMFGPLSTTFPQTIDHMPLNQDFLNDDFVAVRMGDVNGNTPVSFNGDPNDRSNGTLYFNVEDQVVHNGDLIAVPVMANDFQLRQAYQYTIAFDANVFELEDVQMGVLPNMSEENFGMANLDKGYLTTVWVNRDPVSLQDGEVLFTLYFRAHRSAEKLSKIMQAGSQITHAEAYTLEGATQHVALHYVQPGQGLSDEPFVLYQNTPNPFQTSTTIAFRLPESGKATLRVFNSNGQLVKMVVGNFEKGYNELNLRKSDFGAPGVYYYELESAQNSDRRKMILID